MEKKINNLIDDYKRSILLLKKMKIKAGIYDKHNYNGRIYVLENTIADLKNVLK